MNLLGRIPLAPQETPRGLTGASASKDSRLINCVVAPVGDALGGKNELYVYKRQGWEAYASGLAGKRATAVYLSPSSASVAIISGYDTSGSDSDALYYNSTSNSISGTPLHITESVISGTVNYLITTELSTNATKGYYYPEGGSLTQITDGDYPSTTVGPLQELDGWHFIQDRNGVIYQSDLNSISSWTAGNTITASKSSDKGRGLMRQGDFLIAFGNTSIEPFYNAGNALGSVLKPVGGQSWTGIGAASGGTVFSGGTPSNNNSISKLMACKSGDSIYFLGAYNGQVGLYEMQGLRVGKISPPEIDNMLQGFLVSEIWAATWMGQPFVYLGCGTDLQIAYFPLTKKWSEMDFKTSGASTGITASGGNVWTPSTTRYIIGAQTTANDSNLWKMSSTAVWQDGGTAYTMTIQFSDNGFNTSRRKFIDAIVLNADTQSSGTTTLKYSDDDGQNFTTHGSTFDLTKQEKKIYRVGSYKGHRIWRLEDSNNLPWRGRSVDIYGSIGSV